MRIAIIQFPGSNCESESIRAIRTAGMEPEEFLWNRAPQDLAGFDGFFIVGGFSYEDRARSGVVAALDPIMHYLKIEAEKGKGILGICNGAQILVESGLVPGADGYPVCMALAENKREQNGKILGTGFYNAWVNLKLDAIAQKSIFTKNIPADYIMKVPVAHGEGRFLIPPELLVELKEKNLTTFRYCDDNGEFNPEFPVNPNGADYNLAGVSNATGTILALMPHPERTPNGDVIFNSWRDSIIENKTIIINDKINYEPPTVVLANYHQPENSFAIDVELIITDNEAVTVQNALNNLGIDVLVKKATRWENETNQLISNDELKSKIIASGELFNSNKERVADLENPTTENFITILTRYRGNSVGTQKYQILTARAGISGLNSVKKGTLWRISAKNGNLKELWPKILATGVLFNQFSQDAYLLSSP